MSETNTNNGAVGLSDAQKKELIKNAKQLDWKRLTVSGGFGGAITEVTNTRGEDVGIAFSDAYMYTFKDAQGLFSGDDLVNFFKSDGNIMTPHTYVETIILAYLGDEPILEDENMKDCGLDNFEIVEALKMRAVVINSLDGLNVVMNS